MLITQEKVHTEASYTLDFLSRRILYPSMLLILSDPLNNLHNIFFPEREKKITVLQLYSFPWSSWSFFPNCLEDSWGHWDIWLWYGLQNFCYVQGRGVGGGDWLFSLTWQPNESLECWTEFTLKVTLQCRLPYWERERWGKIFCS